MVSFRNAHYHMKRDFDLRGGQYKILSYNNYEILRKLKDWRKNLDTYFDLSCYYFQKKSFSPCNSVFTKRKHCNVIRF